MSPPPGAGQDGPAAPDPGLSRARTTLSWRRYALAVGVVAVLTARLALHRGTVGALAAGLAGLGWLAVFVITLPRFGVRLADRLLPLTALVTAGFAALGVLLVLASMR
jgi:hypothetical protein